MGYERDRKSKALKKWQIRLLRTKLHFIVDILRKMASSKGTLLTIPNLLRFLFHSSLFHQGSSSSLSIAPPPPPPPPPASDTD